MESLNKIVGILVDRIIKKIRAGNENREFTCLPEHYYEYKKWQESESIIDDGKEIVITITIEKLYE